MDRKIEKITSRSNPVCIHIKKLGSSRSYREEHGQFISDGKKLLIEALNSAMTIEIILCSTDLDLELPVTTKVYHVSDSIIDSLSPLRNSREVLFVCRIPGFEEFKYDSGTHILLDTIQDPGNVGTITRSALAFGIDSIVLSEGSSDIYNPKTVRASMGAVFKQRINTKSYKDIYKLKETGLRFLGTTNNANTKDITKVSLKNVIIVLGNEGQGISPDILDLCDDMITIPLGPECESLNVAAAASIIMWEISKGMGS